MKITIFVVTTICVQPWSVNIFSHMFIFQTRQFPRQLHRLDQWKCFVWSTKLLMFVKETWHVLITWSTCLTKLTTFFKVSEAWCHCDFRKMDALKGNKSGRIYRTGMFTDGLSSHCEELYTFCVRRRRTLPNAVEIDILGIFEGYSSLQIWPPQKIFQGRYSGRMT